MNADKNNSISRTKAATAPASPQPAAHSAVAVHRRAVHRRAALRGAVNCRAVNCRAVNCCAVNCCAVNRCKAANRHSAAHRRRATVLVMVMAMLAFIFVIGAALLNSVVFENTALKNDKAQRETSAVVDAVARELEGAIKQSFVGNDGIPYNTEHTFALVGAPPAAPTDVFGTTSLRNVDVYSEKVGDSPLIAPYEPYTDAVAVVPAPGAGALVLNPGAPWIYPYVTDMSTALSGLRHMAPYNVSIDQPILNQNVDGQAGYDTTGDGVADVNGNLADADGDGMPDSRFEPLNNMLGDSLYRKAVSILTPDETMSPPIVGAFRVIPHGGMVNINESPLTVIDSVLTQCLPGAAPAGITALSDSISIAGGSGIGLNPFDRFRYRPSLYEPALRHRFLLGQLRTGQSFETLSDDLTIPGSMDHDGTGELGLGDLFGRRLVGGDADVMGAWAGGDRWTLLRPEDDFGGGYHGFNIYRDWLDPSAIDATAPAGSPELRGRYDLRHLFTTISHDDLLSRNGRQATQPITARYPFGTIESIDQLLFQSGGALSRYPLTLASQPELQTPEDPRIGRLLLSLQDMLINCVETGDPMNPIACPALSDGSAINDYIPISEIILHPDRVAMIRETFRLMLSQVNFPEDVTGTLSGLFEIEVPPSPFNAFVGTAMIPQDQLRDIYAAMLTANLIDFADPDDIPTAVEIVPWMSNPTAGAGAMPNYVFGLERQPYISEVYVEFTDDMSPATNRMAIELCNPNLIDPMNPTGQDINLADYSIRIVDTGGNTLSGPFALNGVLSGTNPSMLNQGFVLIGPGGFFPAPDIMVNIPVPVIPHPSMSGFEIVQDFDVQLIRSANIPTPDSDPPTAMVVANSVVVDQHSWRDDLEDPDTDGNMMPDQTLQVSSEMRDTRISQSYPFITDLGRWYLPYAVVLPSTTHTLGMPNDIGGSPVQVPTGFSPVQVQFANNAFEPTLPTDGADSTTGRPYIRRAYPTTGSLLLLMRYANTDTTSFTKIMSDAIPSGATTTPLDIGRMPVFNQAQKAQATLAGLETQLGLAQGSLNGEFALDVPWGQLVFDYFTALPLYNDPDVTMYDPAMGLPAFDPNLPRVDEGGLRVHGRININAAPWPVLAGLPMLPQESLSSMELLLPPPLRRASIGSLGPDLDAASFPGTKTLGEKRAKAIVAYRDRRLDASFTFTGTVPTLNYNTRANPMGMTGITPTGSTDPNHFLRTGAGFETVGELANVVGGVGSATNDYNIHANETDYLRAIARIVALRDWVTVRSHVFTVYGVLSAEGVRGSDYSVTPPVLGVDEKAIRFQETIDRLPCVYGDEQPARVGQRVISPYLNTPGE